MTRSRAGMVSPYKVAAVLLRYPDPDLLAARAELRAAVQALRPARVRDGFARTLRHLAVTAATDLATGYVSTFDHGRQTSLYLTYHSHGDTRQRGSQLALLKARYRRAGLDPRADELPDYLPVMLEFAALSPDGRHLLAEHLPALELLRRRLHEVDSPYAGVLEGVVALLPRASARQLALAGRLLAAGPADEQVGLEPFATSEAMPYTGGRS